ncbi:FkbM family methyltransferase [Aerosakkonema funiforme]|uniref:FkbM family methyltransferase n=1 Tax=Aerosakkonema funiforme TaxID=1246630 RepID=UPI0035B7365D
MSVFLPSLKKSGHLDRIHMTLCIVGSRKLENQDDYGTQGWNIFAPNLTIYGFDADPEACDHANADVEARQINWVEKHIPLALWNCEGTFPLYVTNFTGCSSLYPPNESYVERFSGYLDLFKLITTVEIDTTTLDSFCASEGIEEIDFIHLDVQGAELQVLQGASSVLERSVLAVVTEVNFTELYINQPLFSDVDVYLRKQGFTLGDLTITTGRGCRTISPIIYKLHPGFLLWADAFYFRDPIRKDLFNNISTPDRILKLACIADVLNFPDYALELLAYLTRNYGDDKNYNFAKNIIDTLSIIPEAIQQGLDSLPIITEMRNYIN